MRTTAKLIKMPAYNIAFVLCRRTDNAASTVGYYQLLSQPNVID
jgi:hypothetical protein